MKGHHFSYRTKARLAEFKHRLHPTPASVSHFVHSTLRFVTIQRRDTPYISSDFNVNRVPKRYRQGINHWN